MDEKKLLALAKKQNKEALSLLLSSNYDIVYGYLIKLCCDKELAKDLTQETMVKAILNLNKFRGDSKVSTWLITIASNIFKNYIKKSKRTLMVADETLFDVMVNTHLNIEDEFIVKDQFSKVMKILNTMKDEQRMPFILKHYYGYPYEDIAKILKCPVGTIRSRIHNTIKKLQSKMKGELYEDMSTV